MLLSAVPLHYLRSLRLCFDCCCCCRLLLLLLLLLLLTVLLLLKLLPLLVLVLVLVLALLLLLLLLVRAKSTTATTTTTVNLTRAPGYANVRQCGLDWQVVSRARGYRNVGALIVTNTILWVPLF